MSLWFITGGAGRARPGNLKFAPGETGKSVSILISEDSFVEGAETATITLSNNLVAGLGNPAATLTMTDDSPESAGNPTDAAEQFVAARRFRQEV